MLDVNELREAVLALNRLPNVDVAYTLHYDETNNIRRLHLTPGGLNVREPQCFVLGGIAHRGPAPPLSFEELRRTLRLQKSAHELKLDHLGKDDFLSLINAPRVEALLDWLTGQPLFVHYQVLDPLYWSIVDVVDSILTEEGDIRLVMLAPMLKSDLYAVLRDDVVGSAEMLGRYDYPDVGVGRRAAFIDELRGLLEARRTRLPHPNYRLLKDLLRIGGDLETLPYLEEETPNVLIDGFGAFYLQRLALFKRATHILDVEPTIQTYLASLDLMDGATPLRNFTFVDSRDHPWVQVSDVVAGLLGKFFTYVNRTAADELRANSSRMSERQRGVFTRLTTLVERSIEECPAFAHYVVSLEDQQRRATLFGF